jgi:hypothetical protein
VGMEPLTILKKFVYTNTGCFLKNAGSGSSVIYCPSLIKTRSDTMVKKTTTKRLDFLFFSTLIVMSNKCHFVFF